jgi:hypothetical protein
MAELIWTDYLRYRARLRRFDLATIEDVVLRSSERYYDTETHRRVAVGKHGDYWILVPYDEHEGGMTPVTVHATSRQQIKFRVRTGRFVNG